MIPFKPKDDSPAAENPKQSILYETLWRKDEPLNGHSAYFFATNDRANPGSFRNVSVGPDPKAQLASLQQPGVDLYFACAVYADANSRTARNALGAYGFWMDIDCGQAKADAGQGYATVAEGRKALSRFCEKAGIPYPNAIVNSGSGIHAHWILDRFLPKDEWQAATRQLKDLCKALGFLADPSRTADIASVLRIPGTLNYKTDPAKPVTLIHWDPKLIEVRHAG
ncbi:MAG: hypothetical protein HQL47_08965 [Gammaproteobacteria bacterium]|nr:hypothetical protein [Gammaproteobacteria bacterium]